MEPTVKRLLAKVKASAPAPAGTETKGNPAPHRTPSVREVFSAPHVIEGELGSSRGYSCQKALNLVRDPRSADQAKLEVHTSHLLDALYVDTKVWKDRARGNDARELLGPVHEVFSEGHQTADIKAARKLLEQLAMTEKADPVP